MKEIGKLDPFSPFKNGKANGLTFMIMQSDENYEKVKYLHRKYPDMIFEEVLNELGLDERDFTDSDYKKAKSIFLR